jgi:hypothetical protein
VQAQKLLQWINKNVVVYATNGIRPYCICVWFFLLCESILFACFCIVGDCIN